METAHEEIILEKEKEYLLKKNFTFINVIGKGASGVVFKCESLKDKKMVAIKKVICNIDSMKSKAEKELRYSLLLHKNNDRVIEAKESLERGTDFYMIYEYAEDGDLKGLIERMGKCNIVIDEQTILNFILQISEGLSKIHEAGYLHRDLKPANIFLGYDCVVKIGDFGITEKSEDSIKHHKKNISCEGTTGFMAPEIISERKYTEKSDIFALGRIIYCLCISQNISSEEEATCELFYSAELVDLYKSMVNKDDSKRPTAKELCEIAKKIMKDKKYKNSPTVITGFIGSNKLSPPTFATIEVGAILVQKIGSAITALIPGFSTDTKECCNKCKGTIASAPYYIGNDNYSQCISCGEYNGKNYYYCKAGCSEWGFCESCMKSNQIPEGACDKMKCWKCSKRTLKSYKYYGLNVRYSNCKNCKASIGLNCFYWYCSYCSNWGYCYKCTRDGNCGIKD